MTTRCAVDDGMTNPQYIPNENIVDMDDETPDDVGKLRPDSDRPFVVDKNQIKLKFWFMPAVPVESVRLPTFVNVKSFTVSYVRQNKVSTEIEVANVCISMKYDI